MAIKSHSLEVDWKPEVLLSWGNRWRSGQLQFRKQNTEGSYTKQNYGYLTTGISEEGSS